MEHNMTIEEFNEELYNFLHHQVHVWKFKDQDIPYDCVEYLLNRLSTKFLASHECLNFFFDGESCWVKTSCGDCGYKICEEFDLRYILKVFKKVWRTGEL